MNAKVSLFEKLTAKSHASEMDAIGKALENDIAGELRKDFGQPQKRPVTFEDTIQSESLRRVKLKENLLKQRRQDIEQIKVLEARVRTAESHLEALRAYDERLGELSA